MHHFHQRNGVLWVEDVSVADLAKEYGTPLYVYSLDTFRDHFQRLDAALAPVDHLICYAMKACSNIAILRELAGWGSGFDIVSGGELFRVMEAEASPAKCTFAGVGKTRDEIEYGLRVGVYCFNVESEAELETINSVAAGLRVKAPVAIRVNPDIDAGTHQKITTGTYENKFGIAFEEVPALYERASRLEHLTLRGLQCHIGSQITKPEPFRQAIAKLVPMARSFKEQYGIEFLDIGGGLGIVYDAALESGDHTWWCHPETPLTIADYAETVLPLVRDLGLRIVVEPGRFVAGNAGILVSEVLFIKNTGRKRFVIVDAAMTDLIRPAFYDSYHQIVPVDAWGERSGQPPVLTDVVGPVCESGDVFCKDRPLPPFHAGDRLAFMSAGAYGSVMASNYNSRPRPAEVLVDGSSVRLIRRRETYADLIRAEVAA